MSTFRPERTQDRLTRRGELRNEQIISVAARLFLEKGFERVTLDEIAKAAKGSKTSLYENYVDKRGVFLAAVDKMLEGVERLLPIRLPDRDGALAGALTEVGREILSVTLAPDHVALYRLAVSEALHFPEIGRRWLTVVPSASKEAVSKILAPHDQALATDLAALFHGMIVDEPLRRALLGEAQEPEQAERLLDRAVAITIQAVELRP